MTSTTILKELEALGSAQTKKVLMRHGAKEPFFGVKVGDLKPIQKRIKMDYQLSMDLYATGNSDAMYLAGLIADDKKMSKEDLEKWAYDAYWYMLSEYTVPWVVSESKYGWELAAEWIQSDLEHIASAGWSTYANLMALKPDEEIDNNLIHVLLEKVAAEIHESKNRVRHTMNHFVIAVGCYSKDLQIEANAVGIKVGKVNVFMGETSCQVPFAPEYIQKVLARNNGEIAKKKKTVKC